LTEALDEAWEEWEVPREAENGWSIEAMELHTRWWEARRERQMEIEASIARNAEIEYLVDRPYEDRGKVRVAGAFTVESLSPHRVLSAEEEDALLAEEVAAEEGHRLPPRTRSARRDEARRAEDDFVRVVLDNLLKAGVQNTKKGEKLQFTELKPWPGGRLVHAEGRYEEGGRSRRVGVTIGPEYGTVSYGLVREAAREALDSVFDTLIVCGFAFEPKVNEEALTRFPRLTVLKARMNNDLHLADSLRSQTNNANLFVIFGEPDITVHGEDGRVRVEILGLDIFDPTTGEVRSSSLDDIAAWFIDTDYDGESFFVRHAYFLGGNDPYRRLKTTLKAEIDEDAWGTLYSPVSRPFEKPETGRIAVKVINHYGDEVLKVYTVV
jgi:adenine-specific DNA-methyltransferase